MFGLFWIWNQKNVILTELFLVRNVNVIGQGWRSTCLNKQITAKKHAKSELCLFTSGGSTRRLSWPIYSLLSDWKVAKSQRFAGFFMVNTNFLYNHLHFYKTEIYFLLFYFIRCNCRSLILKLIIHSYM